MLRISIDTGNDAFQDVNFPAEVARILRDLAGRIEATGTAAGSMLFDRYGNEVGGVRHADEDDDMLELTAIDLASRHLAKDGRR